MCAQAALALSQELTEEQEAEHGEVLRRRIRDLGIYLGRHNSGDVVKAAKDAKDAWVKSGAEAETENMLQSLFVEAGSPSDGKKAKPTLQQLEAALALYVPSAENNAEAAETKEELSSRQLECVIDIGFVAVLNDLLELGTRCSKIVFAYKKRPALVDIKMLYVQSLLLVRQQEPDVEPESERGKALALSRRIEAMKLMERALLTCHRINVPDVMHRGCVMAWNLGLPLLTPFQRKFVHRLFTMAVGFLDGMDSPLVQLRAQLHFELAKCELSSDFITKALEHVDGALRTDYGNLLVDVIDTSEYDIDETLVEHVRKEKERPLDPYLTQLRSRLTLTSSLYETPDSPLEQATLLLEQAKTAKHDTFLQTVLTKAAALLGLNVPTVVQPEKTKGEISLADMTRTMLCSDVMALAWQQKSVKLAKRAFEAVMARKWHPQQFINIVTMQLQALFVAAQISAYELELRVAAINARLPEDAQPVEVALGVVTDNKALVDLKLEVIQHLMSALDYAEQTGKGWMVENVSIHLWNYHAMVFETQQYDKVLPQLLAALERCLASLEASAHVDPVLRCDLARALGCVYEFGKDYGKMVTVSSKCIDLASPSVTKHVLAISARGKVRQGQKPDAVVNSAKLWQHKVLSTIAILQHVSTDAENKVPPAEQHKVLESAYRTLSAQYDAQKAAAAAGEAKFQTVAEAELGVQMWAQLAECALRSGQWELAQLCAFRGSQQLPQNSEAQSALAPPTWRWLSVAESVWGQAVAALIHEEGQDTQVQNKLRSASLDHFELAARWGVKSRRPVLVIDAARHLWNTALPCVQSPLGRQLLFKPVKNTLAYMAEAEVKEDPALRVKLYLVLFDCFQDAGQWQDGLRACIASFQQVDVEYRRPLWEARVLFMSKLGKNVASGVAKMKESDETLLAQMWGTLARSFKAPADQMEAYAAALKALKSSIYRVEYLIEFGEWLQSVQRHEDAVLHLLAANDMLLDVEQRARDAAMDEAELAELEEGEAAGSQRSEAKSVKSSKSVRSVNRFKATAKAIAAFSSTPSELRVSFSEQLVRLNVMLAQLSSTQEQRMYFCHLAQTHAVGMITKAVDKVNTALLTAEFETIEPETLVALAKKWGEPAVTVEVWLPRQEPKFRLPSTLTGWLTYSTPAELVTFWRDNKIALIKEYMLHSSNIKRLDVAFYYFNALIDMLHEGGCGLHAVPVLRVLEILLESCPGTVHDSVELGFALPTLRLRGAVLLESLNMSALAADYRLRAGALGITRERRLKLEEELRRAHGDAGTANSQKQEEDQHQLYRKVMARFTVRSLLLQQVRYAMVLGEYGCCNNLLSYARCQNELAHDHDNARIERYLTASMCAARGDVGTALDVFQEALHPAQTRAIDTEERRRAVLEYAELLARMRRFHEAELVIKDAAEAFQTLRSPAIEVVSSQQCTTFSNNLDIDVALVEFQVELAKLHMQNALMFKSMGSAWSGAWQQAVDCFQSAIARLDGKRTGCRTLGQHPRHAAVLLAYSRAIPTVEGVPADAQAATERHATQMALLLRAEELAQMLVRKCCLRDAHPGLTSPLQLLLADIKGDIGALHLQAAREAYDAKVLREADHLKRWLHENDETRAELTEAGPAQMAIASFSGAETLLRAVPTRQAFMSACAGAASRQLCLLQNCLEKIWTRSDFGDDGDVQDEDSDEDDDGASARRSSLVLDAERQWRSGDAKAKPLTLQMCSLISTTTNRLMRAYAVACQQSNIQAAACSAAELVECFGAWEKARTAAYLCSFQHYFAAMRMREILMAALSPQSRMAILERLHNHLETNLTNAWESPVAATIRAFMQTKTASTVLQANASMDQMLEHIAENQSVVILQQSIDERHLYLAHLGHNEVHAVYRHTWTSAEKEQLEKCRKQFSALPKALKAELLLPEGEGVEVVTTAQASLEQAVTQLQGLFKDVKGLQQLGEVCVCTWACRSRDALVFIRDVSAITCFSLCRCDRFSKERTSPTASPSFSI